MRLGRSVLPLPAQRHANRGSAVPRAAARADKRTAVCLFFLFYHIEGEEFKQGQGGQPLLQMAGNVFPWGKRGWEIVERWESERVRFDEVAVLQ